MTKPKIILVGLLLCFSASLHAQGKFKEFFGNMSIRKSLDGSKKDEAKPAAFSYNRDFKQKNDFYNIDVGIKIAEYELLPNKLSLLTIAPNIEYHVDKRDTFKVHTASGGMNIQSQLVNTDSHKASPVILISANYQGDFVKRDEILKIKSYLTFVNPTGLKPAVNLYSESMTWLFRYYPYVGYEYYHGTSEKKNGTSAYITGRVFFEVWPGTVKRKEILDPVTGVKDTVYRNYVQLTFDLSTRKDVVDDYYKVGQNHWVTVGLNYYPQGIDKIGIGLEYSEGYDPTANFAVVDRLTLGLKVKL